jgi:SAM-dependent methyltransferase
MKIRDSGMPEEVYWESLFDVPLILDHLRVDSSLRDVVELGGGYGTFSLPVARRIRGTLTTIDVDDEMTKRLAARAAEAGLSNIRVVVQDVQSLGFGVPPASQDAALLFNILHASGPVRLLKIAAETLQPGGAVRVIHWRCDLPTPRGPALDIRPRPEQIVQWAEQTGLLQLEGNLLDLPPWHYGLILKRI